MMKKVSLILLTIAFIMGFSQELKPIAKKIQELHTQNKTFVSYNLFNDDKEIKGNEAVSEGTFTTLKTEVLQKIFSEKNQNITLQIPYNDGFITLELYQAQLFTNDFTLKTDKSENQSYQSGVYYRGIIKNNNESIATLNVFKGNINGIISSPELGNIIISEVMSPTKNDYVIYNENKLLATNTNDCNTQDNVEEFYQQPYVNLSEVQRLTNKCVTMYLEIDYNLYESNGSSISATNNWVTSVFNNVQTLYANDNITVALKTVFIWTEQDPYEGVGISSQDYLTAFHNFRPIFNADVGQLLGIDAGNLGGVARTIDGLCTENNYSYSDVSITFANVYTFSWTVEVITHEFGHLLGSRHTHACVWNGNNTAIDGCANFVEGSCAIPTPYPPSGGTIMSYCHLRSVGINLSFGFGPQPSAAIINNVDNSSCLGSDCLSSCLNSVSGITISNVTNTSMQVNWTEHFGNTQWSYAYAPFGSALTNWATTTTKPITISGLLANTYYQVAVKPICPTGSLDNASTIIGATNANFCSGATFYDTGGASANYTDNEHLIRTILPANSGQKVKVNFTAFGLETDFDFLFVYNGLDTTSLEMTGGLTGTTVPTSIESTDASGALTFEFIADAFVNDIGWAATFECLNLGIDEVQFIDFSYYPNPIKNILTLKSQNQILEYSVYNSVGQLVTQQKLNDFSTEIDTSKWEKGTYLVQLIFEQKPVTFKVIKK